MAEKGPRVRQLFTVQLTTKTIVPIPLVLLPGLVAVRNAADDLGFDLRPGAPPFPLNVLPGAEVVTVDMLNAVVAYLRRRLADTGSLEEQPPSAAPPPVVTWDEGDELDEDTLPSPAWVMVETSLQQAWKRKVALDNPADTGDIVQLLQAADVLQVDGLVEAISAGIGASLFSAVDPIETAQRYGISADFTAEDDLVTILREREWCGLPPIPLPEDVPVAAKQLAEIQSLRAELPAKLEGPRATRREATSARKAAQRAFDDAHARLARWRLKAQRLEEASASQAAQAANQAALAKSQARLELRRAALEAAKEEEVAAEQKIDEVERASRVAIAAAKAAARAEGRRKKPAKKPAKKPGAGASTGRAGKRKRSDGDDDEDDAAADAGPAPVPVPSTFSLEELSEILTDTAYAIAVTFYSADLQKQLNVARLRYEAAIRALVDLDAELTRLAQSRPDPPLRAGVRDELARMVETVQAEKQRRQEIQAAKRARLAYLGDDLLSDGVCASCGAEHPTYRCSECRQRYYCSAACQLTDWQAGGHSAGHALAYVVFSDLSPDLINLIVLGAARQRRMTVKNMVAFSTLNSTLRRTMLSPDIWTRLLTGREFVVGGAAQTLEAMVQLWYAVSPGAPTARPPGAPTDIVAKAVGARHVAGLAIMAMLEREARLIGPLPPGTTAATEAGTVRWLSVLDLRWGPWDRHMEPGSKGRTFRQRLSDTGLMDRDFELRFGALEARNLVLFDKMDVYPRPRAEEVARGRPRARRSESIWTLVTRQDVADRRLTYLQIALGLSVEYPLQNPAWAANPGDLLSTDSLARAIENALPYQVVPICRLLLGLPAAAAQPGPDLGQHPKVTPLEVNQRALETAINEGNFPLFRLLMGTDPETPLAPGRGGVAYPGMVKQMVGFNFFQVNSPFRDPVEATRAVAIAMGVDPAEGAQQIHEAQRENLRLQSVRSVDASLGINMLAHLVETELFGCWMVLHGVPVPLPVGQGGTRAEFLASLGTVPAATEIRGFLPEWRTLMGLGPWPVSVAQVRDWVEARQ